MDIVGIILAGGIGKRLAPLTQVANKHLLPVYDRPMIFFPLEKMTEAGLREILIVCGEDSKTSFQQLLGDGSELGIEKLSFTTQIGEDGIAAALLLAEEFVGGRNMCVILGDNLFDDDISSEVEAYRSQGHGARVLLKSVHDPERFGVPVLDGDRIIRIEEKPANPASPYAVVGIYFYDSRVFDVIRTLQPSARGEYEITDVSNWYIDEGDLTYGFLRGSWSDCGTFESLFRASQLVRERRLSKKEDALD